MEKMTWSEANDYLTEYNRKLGYTHKGNEKVCTMVAVISEDSFNQPYTLEERSYKFTSDNKAFLPNIGYSIFASSLDGSDVGVRLEQYVGTGKDDWKVDYCYIMSED